MHVTRIPIDGLLRCLCPGIEGLTIIESPRSLRAVRKAPIRPKIPDLRLRRFQSSAPAQSENTQDLVRTYKYSGVTPVKTRKASDRASGLRSEPPFFRTVDINSTRPGVLGEKFFARYDTLDDVPVAHIHERLRQATLEDDEYNHVVELVEHLITKRGVKPELIHYEALIRVNVDAAKGSAGVVERLLKDMKDEGVNADSGLYHAVLQVLAIHPDYLLRNQVMQEMKERWLGLSPEGWHSLVIGLLRDRQFEAAMEKLEQMQSDEIRVQPWLYDIFIHQLCEIGELDEAFRLLRYRFDNRRAEISPTLWYYLLDVFSSHLHYAGANFVWKARVQPSQLVPSDGICVNTLNVAARAGDPGLATSAIRILAARRSALSPFHYEALITAYTEAKDIKTSLRILAIMAKAGLEPDSSTTRPLFLYLSANRSLTDKAWQLLKALNHDGHLIPTAAANVVMEAKIKQGAFLEAIELYKELNTISKSGPNTETFNVLLQGTARFSEKSMAMFLASEMRALGVKPDRLTYDRFILVCLKEEDYEDAFRYLEEMRIVGADKEEDGQKGWYMRGGTAMSLVRRCTKANDHRVWHLLTEMEQRNLVEGRFRKWVESNFEGQERSRNQSNEKLLQRSAM